ncbi:MAG: winged helix-turn-helix domain-containing protein, partial [Oscillospiraceae bacterium]
MTDDLIRINMLGDFSISSKGVTVSEDELSRQLCVLLSYLVVNKTQNISCDELSAVLWPNEIANSSGALKNLVYRLRKVLQDNNFP